MQFENLFFSVTKFPFSPLYTYAIIPFATQRKGTIMSNNEQSIKELQEEIYILRKTVLKQRETINRLIDTYVLDTHKEDCRRC